LTLEEAMRRALSERTADAAWAHLEPFRAEVARDPEVAHAWAALLQASPSRPAAAEDALAILGAFGELDPALAAAAVTALVRVDERRGFDEPVPRAAPAELAEREASRVLSRLDAAALADPDRGGALRVARANALRRVRREREAAAEIERALADHGPRGDWLADLGLARKHAGDFRGALEAFSLSRDRLGATRRLSHDVAICAIGAGDADAAAAALEALGHRVLRRDGALPFVPDLPPIEVRVPTRGPGHAMLAVVPDQAVSLERVRAQPLSPVHGVLLTPTFRDAIADWGDVVLWDAAPVARASHDGRDVPVMPLLAVLSRGGERRFRWIAMEQREGQTRALARRLPEGAVLYEHGARVERLCARCAAGDTLVKHTHEPPTEHRAAIGKLLAPPSIDLGALRAAIEGAVASEPGVLFACPALYEALGDAETAGKHHKTWGAIERAAGRPR
jgi:hypothetical protein